MKKYIFGVLSILLILCFQNCAPVHQGGEAGGGSSLSTIGGGDALSSISAFETTLHPIVMQSCGGCHGVNQQPLFAVSQPQQSHDNLVNASLVNLLTPAQSRIVQKIRGGHQGISSQIATDMELAITAWATALQNSGGGSGGGGLLPAPPVLAATFESIHALVLTPKCLGCHSPGGVRPSENYSSYQTTISTGKVAPGNANGSEMYTECVNGSMPEAAPALTVEELAAIEEWINDGALNN